MPEKTHLITRVSHFVCFYNTVPMAQQFQRVAEKWTCTAQNFQSEQFAFKICLRSIVGMSSQV